jgi:Ca2+ transporting ATPase
MDALASLALATEPPENSLLKRPPVKRTDFIVNTQMWFNMLGHAAYQIVVCLFIVFCPQYLPSSGEEVPDPITGKMMQGSKFNELYPTEKSEHYTFLFGVFVFLQLFNEFNSRKVHGECNVFSGILKNPYFITIWVATVIIQIIFLQIGGKALSCKYGGLNTEQWIWCLAIGVVELPVQQVINLVARMFIKDVRKRAPKVGLHSKSSLDA